MKRATVETILLMISLKTSSVLVDYKLVCMDKKMHVMETMVDL